MHELRRIDARTYDVFVGMGWDNWSRIRQGRSSTYRVSGEHVSKPDLRDWHEVLAPNMPITYGQTTEDMLKSINAINRG